MTSISQKSPEQTQRDRVILDGEERYRQLAEIAPMMTWMSGTDKLCIYLNRSWLDFTGLPLSAHLGNGWADSLHPDDRLRSMQIYVDAFDLRKDFKMEYRLRRYDGAYRWMFVMGAPRYSSEGNFEGYIGSCADISDRKEIESERIKLRELIAQLNRTSSMGQLSASLAHELAQPLAAILSNAQAAARYANMSSPNMTQIREALAEIVADDRRAHAFVQTMRSMFQKKRLSIVSLDLNRCVVEISRIILVDAARRGVDAQVNLASDDVYVMGDCVAMQQIILNLANNGMDALQHVRANARRLRISVKAQPKENVGSIIVEDNGAGVAEENREKLFGPFYTTKEGGLGLGLSICRSLVESLGGRIALVHHSGPGALFQVDLPLAQR